MDASERFVAAPQGEGSGPEAQLYRCSRAVSGMPRSMMRDMLARTARPGVISFAGGLPAPELFPADDYRACLEHVLTHDGQGALQYGPPCVELKEAVARIMTSRGVTPSPEDVFITNGAQQALYLLSLLLVDPGSPVILEETLYTGISQALRLLRPQCRTVSTDPHRGIELDQVERQMARAPRPRALFAIPDFHNPLGVSLGIDQRARLVALGRRFGVPIIEDDPYGALRFSAPPYPALKAWDEEDGVIYVGSFSKILAPALRLGWIIAPPSLVPPLTVLKETVDLETSVLTQRAVAEFCRRGHLESHVAHVRTVYRQRLQVMLDALAREFPAGTRWTSPEGGMFIWVVLPEGMDTMALLPQALDRQVAFIPGAAFAVRGGAPNTLRLNFSHASPEAITEGMERLGQVVRAALP